MPRHKTTLVIRYQVPETIGQEVISAGAADFIMACLTKEWDKLATEGHASRYLEAYHRHCAKMTAEARKIANQTAMAQREKPPAASPESAGKPAPATDAKPGQEKAPSSP